MKRDTRYEKAYVVGQWNVSGEDTILVNKFNSKVPFPISISVNDEHIVSLSKEGTRDLIRCLLEVL